MGTINQILGTAFAAFRAIVIEAGEKETVVIHSGMHDRLLRNSPYIDLFLGFWGCGAYGGNKVLMLLLQMLAASLAGISRLVLHVMGLEEPWLMATDYYSALVDESGGSVTKFLHLLEGKNLKWGVSNGT